MAFWDWLTGRQAQKERQDKELLGMFLQGQIERTKSDADIAKLRNDVEIKRLELEYQNLELAAEQKRKDAEAKARLREQRREWATKAREKVKANREQASQTRIRGSLEGCVVCADPANPNVTSEEMVWHISGHPGAQTNG